ncbi:hepatic lectin-like [Tubulanus polymorphus]|uniref:hepatic lectin-like n=1 Tax=Tubulanus polymorphus TaxID=672921 RepID=UPI003DA5223C
MPEFSLAALFDLDNYPCGNNPAWQLDPGNKKCLASFSKLNADKARADCKTRGGQLITIRNWETWKWLRAKTTKGYIIGLNDIKEANKLVWNSETKPARFFNWRDGEPNGSGDDCAMNAKDSGGKWNDIKCKGSDLMYYCEKPIRMLLVLIFHL